MRTTAQKPTGTQQANTAPPLNDGRTPVEETRDADARTRTPGMLGSGGGEPLPRPKSNGTDMGGLASTFRVAHTFGQIPVLPQTNGILQRKAKISTPEDPHEREADRTADRIMRMPEPTIMRKCDCGGECPKCSQVEEEKGSIMDGRVMRKQDHRGAVADETATPNIVSDVLRAPGTPLEPSVRSFFEPRFGHDFSRVRIHTGDQAAESARAINAKAYTFGPNIVFGNGEYNPRSAAGKTLLAHELTHVRQQAGLGGGRIDRFIACGTTETCPPRDSGEENAARTEPMSLHQVADPYGILVANFAVGSGRVKSDLAANQEFLNVQTGMRGNPDFRWNILGFSDCEGGEATNTTLRGERATALLNALPADLRTQITETRGAPIGDCMQSNSTAAGRRLNRSAFMMRTVTAYTLPEVQIVAHQNPYGVTSRASQYFVRTSPNTGEIIGQLVLREMRVRVIDEWGPNVDNLWLKVRFSAADMAAIQAAYQQSMAANVSRLPGLQTRRTELQQHIQQLESRPGMPFEVQPEITRAREQLTPIENEIAQIQAYQRRLVTPYTDTAGWVSAAALGVVAMHYDTFLNMIDQFDADHAHQPIRERLTRLRQFGEDASLEGDRVVGTGGSLPNRVTQSDRGNTSDWQLFFEGKQVLMPDGSFIDAHHFILGLDALALPASAQSSSRVLRSYLVASVDVGESWSATTWSGDVGGAVGDFVLHKSGAWERANPTATTADRLRFYFETRAPDMDLLADIDAWGAFGAIPRTNAQTTSFTSLRQIVEATYGPAGQTSQEFTAQVTPTRRRGVDNFLCNYGFSSPTGLIAQTAARARVLEQVRIFATGWYDARASSTPYQTVFGRTDATDASIATASGQMTDIFLNWLERLASTVGLTSVTCDSMSGPLRDRR